MQKNQQSNMSNPYQHYSVNDFDRYDCLKLSKGIYLLLAFVIRGYLVWLASVTNFRDGSSIVSLIFPETFLFYLSLVSGLLGVFVVIILSQRKPEAPAWVEKIWPNIRLILIAALLFDVSVNLTAFALGKVHSLPWVISQIVIACIFIYFCFRSKRLALNLKEFPQKVTIERNRKHRSEHLPKLKDQDN